MMMTKTSRLARDDTLKDADAADEEEDPGALGFGDVDLGATL